MMEFFTELFMPLYVLILFLAIMTIAYLDIEGKL